jgi:hypothetical protein
VIDGIAPIDSAERYRALGATRDRAECAVRRCAHGGGR